MRILIHRFSLVHSFICAGEAASTSQKNFIGVEGFQFLSAANARSFVRKKSVSVTRAAKNARFF